MYFLQIIFVFLTRYIVFRLMTESEILDIESRCRIAYRSKDNS